MTSYEQARDRGIEVGHGIYRGLYAEGIPVSTLDSHVNKSASFDAIFDHKDQSNPNAFNGYLAGLAIAESEVLVEGARL